MNAIFEFEITHSAANLVDSDDLDVLASEQFEAARRVVPGGFPGHLTTKRFRLVVANDLTVAEIAALVDAVLTADLYEAGHELGYGAEFGRNENGDPTVYYTEGTAELAFGLEDGAVIDYIVD